MEEEWRRSGGEEVGQGARREEVKRGLEGRGKEGEEKKRGWEEKGDVQRREK